MLYRIFDKTFGNRSMGNWCFLWHQLPIDRLGHGVAFEQSIVIILQHFRKVAYTMAISISTPFFELMSGPLFTLEEARIWAAEHIATVVKADSAEYGESIVLSLDEDDETINQHAMKVLVRLIIGQAVWVQRNEQWRSAGKVTALIHHCTDLRNPQLSLEEYEVVKATFLQKDSEVEQILQKKQDELEAREQKARDIETLVGFIANERFMNWAFMKLRHEWMRDEIAKRGGDPKAWQSCPPKSLSILVIDLTRLEQLRQSMLLKPTGDSEPAKKPTPKKPGSASKRKPRVRDEDGKLVKTSTRSLSAREARQKSKRKG